MKLHYVFVPVEHRYLFFTSDFRSTLDDIDVFALISFMALKEYCTLVFVHFPRWLYWVIPLNYLLIGFNCFELFLLFIPLAGFLILATGEFLLVTLRFSAYREHHFLWLDNDRFALSHAARLLILPTINTGAGRYWCYFFWH